MNLKKSDKMIAGVAVVILIIAAIGIILYTDEGSDENSGAGDKEEYMYYKVGVRIHDEVAEPENMNFQVKNNQNYMSMLNIPANNIKSIIFEVNYKDSLKGLLGLGILKSFGTDSFTFKVLDSNDELIDKLTISGEGTKNITINFYDTDLTPEAIKAESEEDAQIQIDELNEGTTMNTSYKLVGDLSVGEMRVIRKIWELLFKDTFTLTINYEYCEYYLDGVIDLDNNDEEPPTELNPSGNDRLKPYSSMCITGFH